MHHRAGATSLRERPASAIKMQERYQNSNDMQSRQRALCIFDDATIIMNELLPSLFDPFFSQKLCLFLAGSGGPNIPVGFDSAM